VAARLAVVVLALAVAACDSTPTASPSPTATPQPTPTVTTYQLDTTVWYAGLVMTFGTATATLDERGGTLTLALQLQNPGPDDLTLDSPIRVTVGGAVFEPTRETVLPSIAAGGSGYTTLTFNIVGQTSVDGAVLRVGPADRHQGVVPFGPGGVAAVTLEPVDATLHGTAVAGDLRLVLSHGQLRWDLPDWADELPAATASLTLTYDVTYAGSFSGGTSFTRDNISLRLPNGQTLDPRADGRIQSSVVIGPGKTVKRLSTRFEIPAGLSGTYTLLLGHNGKQGKIRFALPH
jgi:hypothetical protein